MKRNSLGPLEKAVICIGLVLIAALLCGLWLLLRGAWPPEEQLPTRPAPTESTQAPTEEPTLSGPDFFLPEHLAFGEKLPVTQFQTASGETVDLFQQYPGTRLVLMYWGSWCPYCEKQLEQLDFFRQTVQALGNTRLILVNKTDGEKGETPETGERYLSEKGWDDVSHVYDVALNAYRAYGVKRIPTTIVVDEKGYVRAMSCDVLDARGLEELLEQALFGNAKKQLAFLQSNMMNDQGGIYTSSRGGTGTSPQGQDVLSESMGLLMNCAVQMDDKALFDRTWSFVSQSMEQEGLAAWYVTAEGTHAGANALLDDLRIAKALAAANEKWGGYQQALEAKAAAILEKNTYRQQLCSFYDFRQKQPGSTISLTYGDFAALDALAAAAPEIVPLRDKLLQLVEGGYIGAHFPLYYSAYNYQKNSYSAESLNTAEALLTVYHLAQIGRVQQPTLDWLKNALQTGTLAARYWVDGEAVAGYGYDSTAVFAIAALIGQSVGDGDLYRLAREKMEQGWTDDGFFTLGGDILSFDQLMPMTVYTLGAAAVFDD